MHFSRAFERTSFNLAAPLFSKFFLMILQCSRCHQYCLCKRKYFTSLKMCTSSINSYHQNVGKKLNQLTSNSPNHKSRMFIGTFFRFGQYSSNLLSKISITLCITFVDLKRNYDGNNIVAFQLYTT